MVQYINTRAGGHARESSALAMPNERISMSKLKQFRAPAVGSNLPGVVKHALPSSALIDENSRKPKELPRGRKESHEALVFAYDAGRTRGGPLRAFLLR